MRKMKIKYKLLNFNFFNIIKIIFTLWIFIFIFSCQKDEPIQPDPTPSPESVQKDSIFNIDVVPEITLTFQLNDWNKILTNYDLYDKNDKKVVAHFKFVSEGKTIILDSIGVRLRGNTSRRRPEGTYGQLHNAQNPDWHHCHFGLDFNKYKNQKFKGLEKLNLKWFKDDATYIREIYCYDLFKKNSVWTAPRASYCKLIIKVLGDSQPAYYGIYMMLENIDEDYLSYRKDEWNENGFLWKNGWANSKNADFVHTQYIGIENITLNPATSYYYVYDLKTRENELAAGKSELIQFITDLNSKTGEQFKNWFSQKIDVDLFLKTIATSVITGMWDDYWVNGCNFYFYMSPNGKYYYIPIDFDNTLGTSQIIQNSGIQNPLYWGGNNNRPLITKILEFPEYQMIYKNHIRNLVNANNNLFDTEKSKMRIVQWQTMISPYIYNDTGEDMYLQDKPAYWGNCSFYRINSGNANGGSNGEANFFSSRIASMPF